MSKIETTTATAIKDPMIERLEKLEALALALQSANEKLSNENKTLQSQKSALATEEKPYEAIRYKIRSGEFLQISIPGIVALNRAGEATIKRRKGGVPGKQQAGNVPVLLTDGQRKAFFAFLKELGIDSEAIKTLWSISRLLESDGAEAATKVTKSFSLTDVEF